MNKTTPHNLKKKLNVDLQKKKEKLNGFWYRKKFSIQGFDLDCRKIWIKIGNFTFSVEFVASNFFWVNFRLVNKNKNFFFGF